MGPTLALRLRALFFSATLLVVRPGGGALGLVYENAVEFGFSRIFILALSFSLGGLEGGGLMLGSALGLEFKPAATDNPGAEE